MLALAASCLLLAAAGAVGGIAVTFADAGAEPRPSPARSQGASTLSSDYCDSVRDPAREARFAHQAKVMAESKKAIEEKLGELEQKTAELKTWVESRERLIKSASENVVSLYAGMAAEAASLQLVAMSEITAAAIVMRLPSRTASAILAEMEPDRAARLAAIIASVGELGLQGRTDNQAPQETPQ